MTMTLVNILSAAVIAEVVVLAGVLALALRLRARLARVSAGPSDALARMTELVQEAEALGEELADRLAEHVRLSDALEARLRAAASAPPTPAATRRKAAHAEESEAGVAAKPAARSRARTATEATSRADQAVGDAAAAREKGMDPLGIALQRSLTGKRSALA